MVTKKKKVKRSVPKILYLLAKDSRKIKNQYMWWVHATSLVGLTWWLMVPEAAQLRDWADWRLSCCVTTSGDSQGFSSRGVGPGGHCWWPKQIPMICPEEEEEEKESSCDHLQGGGKQSNRPLRRHLFFSVFADQSCPASISIWPHLSCGCPSGLK